MNDLAKECKIVLVKNFNENEVEKAFEKLSGLHSDPREAITAVVEAFTRPVRKTPGFFFCFAFALKPIFEVCILVMQCTFDFTLCKYMGTKAGKQF